MPLWEWRGPSEHHLVLEYGGNSAPACPADTTLRPDFPEQQKGRGGNTALPGRGFHKHRFPPFEGFSPLPPVIHSSLLSSKGRSDSEGMGGREPVTGTLPPSPHATSLASKALNPLLLSLPSRREMTVQACVSILLKSRIKHDEDRAHLSFLPFFSSATLPRVHG